MDLESVTKDCTCVFEDAQFNRAFVEVLAMQRIENISNILHDSGSLPHHDIFKSLDILLSDLCTHLKHFEMQMEKIRILLNTYAILGTFSPRVTLLLRYSIIFIIDDLMFISEEKRQKLILEERDVKRLSTVFATVILNITANPKVWLGGTPDIILVEWKKDLERHKIDEEIFLEYKEYLTNNFIQKHLEKS